MLRWPQIGICVITLVKQWLYFYVCITNVEGWPFIAAELPLRISSKL